MSQQMWTYTFIGAVCSTSFLLGVLCTWIFAWIATRERPTKKRYHETISMHRELQRTIQERKDAYGILLSTVLLNNTIAYTKTKLLINDEPDNELAQQILARLELNEGLSEKSTNLTTDVLGLRGLPLGEE